MEEMGDGGDGGDGGCDGGYGGLGPVIGKRQADGAEAVFGAAVWIRGGRGSSRGGSAGVRSGAVLRRAWRCRASQIARGLCAWHGALRA